MLGQKFYTIPEAAKAINVSRTTVYNLINAGHLTVTCIGRRTVRIAEADLEAFLRSRPRRNASAAAASTKINTTANARAAV